MIVSVRFGDGVQDKKKQYNYIIMTKQDCDDRLNITDYFHAFVWFIRSFDFVYTYTYGFLECGIIVYEVSLYLGSLVLVYWRLKMSIWEYGSNKTINESNEKKMAH